MPQHHLEPRQRLPPDKSIFEMMIVVAIVLLVCLAHVDSYPQRPPVIDNPDICSTMSPAHGTASQTSPPPYVIAINGQTTPYCYVQGQQATVTLSGLGNATFRGFFVQASLTNGTASYGVFANNDDDNVTPFSCNGGSNNVIGHNNGNEKTSVTFTWTPPSSLTETITLTTSVVQIFKIFWVQGVNLSLAECAKSTALSSSSSTIPGQTASPALAIATNLHVSMIEAPGQMSRPDSFLHHARMKRQASDRYAVSSPDDNCANGYFDYSSGVGDVCVCELGYQAESSLGPCTDIDECALGTFQCGTTNAACKNTQGSYLCVCPAGQQLDTSQRNCIDCPVGKFGPNCQNVCQCAMNTTCDPANGCSKCMATGLTGGNCDIDINECLLTADICGPHGTCNNLMGSYQCLCDTWYRKTNLGCELLDPCMYNQTFNNRYPNPLALCNYPHGICTSNSSIAGSATCNCSVGYGGDQCQYVINYCLSDPCFNNGTCLNFTGGFTCRCMPYFSGRHCQIHTVPLVFKVWPLFGPVAGGTYITITRPKVNFSSAYVALSPADNLQYDVIRLSAPVNNGTPLYDSLIAVTPDVSDTQPVDAQRKHLAVNVMFDGGLLILFTQTHFDFRPNANINGVSPTDHLVTGGTLVTITGTDLDCSADPKIQITVVINGFQNGTNTTENTSTAPPLTVQTSTATSECTIVNNTAVTCRMPPVHVDWMNVTNATSGDSGTGPIAVAGNDTTQYTLQKGHDKVSITVGMTFDNFKGYKNFTSSLPKLQLNFFSPPTINNLDVIDFNPRQQTNIQIRGENLQRGVQMADYLVTIGSEQCVVKDLTSNVLHCQPPFVEPPLSGSTDHLCTRMQLNAVKVGIGAEWQFCACIRYVDDPPNIGLIVGLTVGLGLPLIVIVIVVAVILCRRRKTKHDNNGRQRAPPDTEHRQHYISRLPSDLNASENKRSDDNDDTFEEDVGNRVHTVGTPIKAHESHSYEVVDTPEVHESISTTSKHTAIVRQSTYLRPHPHPPSFFPSDTYRQEAYILQT